MKKFKNVCMCMVAALLAITMFSCGDDDDETVGSESDLIGTWVVIQDEGYEKYDGETHPWNDTYPEGKGDTYIFKADYTVGGSMGRGTWSYKGNKLTIDYTEHEDEEDIEVWTVLELTSTRLVKEYREKDGGDEFYMKVTCKKK